MEAQETTKALGISTAVIPSASDQAPVDLAAMSQSHAAAPDAHIPRPQLHTASGHNDIPMKKISHQYPVIKQTAGALAAWHSCTHQSSENAGKALTKIRANSVSYGEE